MFPPSICKSREKNNTSKQKPLQHLQLSTISSTNHRMFLKNFSSQLCFNHMCNKILPKAERMKKMIQDLAAGKSYELGPTSVSCVEGALFEGDFYYHFCFVADKNVQECFFSDS